MCLHSFLRGSLVVEIKALGYNDRKVRKFVLEVMARHDIETGTDTYT